MRKIPTIFERDWNGDRSRVLNIPNPECQWVFDGEGITTRKVDGTCCLLTLDGLLKRRELKKGETAPPNFTEAGYDEETGKTVGWVPIGDGPEDQYHREALAARLADFPVVGTHELVGPKIQGNPEKVASHILWPHSELGIKFDLPPRDFDGLKGWMVGKDIEGIVFHHPDGRMAKIKLRDFGLKRGEGK